nr:hypothetical protein [Alkalicoccobacillus plakortidis]
MELLKDIVNYMVNNIDLLLLYTGQHLLMVVCGIAAALIVGTLLGIVAHRYKRLAPVILAVANILQVIPSLALLAVLMLYFGLGFYTVVVGLFLYSLLPIIRHTHVGLQQVDPAIQEAWSGYWNDLLANAYEGPVTTCYAFYHGRITDCRGYRHWCSQSRSFCRWRWLGS